jgi:hypothetical protein
MKDDSLPSALRPFVLTRVRADTCVVSAYGLRANSTLALVGTGAPPPRAEKPPPPARTEQSTIAAISAVVDGVRGGLLPDVERLLAALPPPTSTTEMEGQKITPAQKSEHLRLGELLLQALLRLDALGADGEWPDARAARRGAVREVQGLLDRLDARWADAQPART